eukprot:CAMPEP_0116555766 /NCGR_PEP_ID=MMETSP0397-20121206/8325_1 /TAXON_ID=216820 /ORGANISM="Cyclophora tenuis, Strain ECT3854" /LENGTH=310 /DNA_ID=CAMNT_0004081065 /DNA_START=51 /DNA_END=983 /DNA_ORIENTATION=+
MTPRIPTGPILGARDTFGFGSVTPQSGNLQHQQQTMKHLEAAFSRAAQHRTESDLPEHQPTLTRFDNNVLPQADQQSESHHSVPQHHHHHHDHPELQHHHEQQQQMQLHQQQQQMEQQMEQQMQQHYTPQRSKHQRSKHQRSKHQRPEPHRPEPHRPQPQRASYDSSPNQHHHQQQQQQQQQPSLPSLPSPSSFEPQQPNHSVQELEAAFARAANLGGVRSQSKQRQKQKRVAQQQQQQPPSMFLDGDDDNNNEPEIVPVTNFVPVRLEALSWEDPVSGTSMTQLEVSDTPTVSSGNHALSVTGSISSKR